MMTGNAVTAGGVFVKIALNNEDLNKGLKESQGKIQNFAKAVKAWSTEVGFNAAMVHAPFVKALQVFSEFDLRMRQVRAITNATGQAFDELSAQARKLGRETSFTTDQISTAMVELARLGFTVKEVKNAIRPVMNLARATGSTLSDAAIVAGNNMRVFGKTSEELAGITDVVVTTVNKSAQTLQDFAEAAAKAGPNFVNTGADINEMAASLGVLANMGIRGSIAGTALSRAVKRLANPKVRDILKGYNIEVTDIYGNMKPLHKNLMQIAKVMNNLSHSERITLAEEIFEVRGSLAALPLVTNVEAIDNFLDALNKSSGAASRLAKDMDSGIFGALQRLISAFNDLYISIGDLFSFSFIGWIEWITKTVNGLNKTNSILGSILKYAIQFGTVMSVLGALTKLTSMWFDALKMLTKPLFALNALLSGTAKKQKEVSDEAHRQSLKSQADKAKEIAANKAASAASLEETAKQKKAELDAAKAMEKAKADELKAQDKLKTDADAEIAKANVKYRKEVGNIEEIVSNRNAEIKSLESANSALNKRLVLEKQSLASSQKMFDMARKNEKSTMENARKSGSSDTDKLEKATEERVKAEERLNKAKASVDSINKDILSNKNDISTKRNQNVDDIAKINRAKLDLNSQIAAQEAIKKNAADTSVELRAQVKEYHSATVEAERAANAAKRKAEAESDAAKRLQKKSDEATKSFEDYGGVSSEDKNDFQRKSDALAKARAEEETARQAAANAKMDEMQKAYRAQDLKDEALYYVSLEAKQKEHLANMEKNAQDSIAVSNDKIAGYQKEIIEHNAMTEKIKANAAAMRNANSEAARQRSMEIQKELSDESIAIDEKKNTLASFLESEKTSLTQSKMASEQKIAAMYEERNARISLHESNLAGIKAEANEQLRGHSAYIASLHSEMESQKLMSANRIAIIEADRDKNISASNERIAMINRELSETIASEKAKIESYTLSEQQREALIAQMVDKESMASQTLIQEEEDLISAARKSANDRIDAENESTAAIVKNGEIAIEIENQKIAALKNVTASKIMAEEKFMTIYQSNFDKQIENIKTRQQNEEHAFEEIVASEQAALTEREDKYVEFCSSVVEHLEHLHETEKEHINENEKLELEANNAFMQRKQEQIEAERQYQSELKRTIDLKRQDLNRVTDQRQTIVHHAVNASAEHTESYQNFIKANEALAQAITNREIAEKRAMTVSQKVSHIFADSHKSHKISIGYIRRHTQSLSQLSIAEVYRAAKTSGASKRFILARTGEAIAVKAATGAIKGYRVAVNGLSKAMDLLISNIAMVAFAALPMIFSAISHFADKAAKSVNEVSNKHRIAAENAGEQVEKTKKVIQMEQDQIRYLVDLEKAGSATEEQQSAALTIIDSLKSKYKGLNITIDELTGKLNGAITAQQILNKVQKEAMLKDLKKQLEEEEKTAQSLMNGMATNINNNQNGLKGVYFKITNFLSGQKKFAKEYEEMMENMGYRYEDFRMDFDEDTGRFVVLDPNWVNDDLINIEKLTDEEIEEIRKKIKKGLDFGKEKDLNVNKVQELLDTLDKVIARRKAIAEVNNGNLSGETGNQNLPEVAEVPKENDIKNAKKRIADMEDQFSQRYMTNLQRETQEIQRQKEEYLKYIDVLKRAADAKMKEAEASKKAHLERINEIDVEIAKAKEDIKGSKDDSEKQDLNMQIQKLADEKADLQKLIDKDKRDYESAESQKSELDFKQSIMAGDEDKRKEAENNARQRKLGLEMDRQMAQNRIDAINSVIAQKNAEASERLNDNSQSIQRHKQNMEDSNAMMEKYQGNLSSARAARSDALERRDKIYSKLSEIDVNVPSVDELKKELKNLNDSIASYDEEIERLSVDFNLSENSMLGNSKKEAHRKLEYMDDPFRESTIDDFNKEIDEIDKEIQSYDDKIKEHHIAGYDLMNKRNELFGQSDIISAQIESALNPQAFSKRNEIAKLQDRLNTTNDKILKNDDYISYLESDIEQLTQTLLEAAKNQEEEKYYQSESTLKDRVKELNSAKMTRASLVGERSGIEQLQKKLESTSGEAIDVVLQEQRQKALEQRELLKSQLEKAQKISELREQLKDDEDDIVSQNAIEANAQAGLERELLNKQLEEGVIEGFEQKAEDLKSKNTEEINRLQEELKKLTDSIVDYTSQIDAADAEIAKIEESKSEFQKKLELAQSEEQKRIMREMEANSKLVNGWTDAQGKRHKGTVYEAQDKQRAEYTLNNVLQYKIDNKEYDRAMSMLKQLLSINSESIREATNAYNSLLRDAAKNGYYNGTMSEQDKQNMTNEIQRLASLIQQESQRQMQLRDKFLEVQKASLKNDTSSMGNFSARALSRAMGYDNVQMKIEKNTSDANKLIDIINGNIILSLAQLRTLNSRLAVLQ